MLCSKCREKILKVFPISGIKTIEISHCHHLEPEEKPKCWCETEWDERTGNFFTKGTNVFETRNCPECGKLLTKKEE